MATKKNSMKQVPKRKPNKKRQLEDQEFRYATIEITKIREVFKIGKSSYEYKDKMYCVDIDYEHGGLGFCETNLKKLSKAIKEDFYL